METDYTSSVSDEESSDSSSDEEDKEVPIVIPPALISKLEEDCYTINCKHKLVKLPCTPSVLTILEDYIKYFAESIDKQAKHVPVTYVTSSGVQREFQQPPPPTNNVRLCREVMDGLRVMFDFMLPACLLYLPEKKQYEVVVAKKKVTTQENTQTKADDSVSQTTTTQTKARKRSRKSSSGSISPPVLEPQVSPSFDVATPEETETTRRITRRLSSSGNIGSPATLHSETKKKDNTSQNVKSSSSGDQSPHKKGRSSRHSSRLAPHTSCPPDISQDKLPTATNQPPAQLPLQTEDVEPKHASTCSRTKKEIRNAKHILETACFMLVPENASLDGCVLPSKMYGMHHLLRLFVKLPELLGKMDIPPKKLKPLQKHLDIFLRYLASTKRIEVLFNKEAYVDWASGF
ncbi:MSL complex subunit 3B-like isoform X2 [Antedon mediterranea]